MNCSWGTPYFQTRPQLASLQPGGHSKPSCWAQSPRWDSASRAVGRWGECTWLHRSTIGQPHEDAGYRNCTETLKLWLLASVVGQLHLFLLLCARMSEWLATKCYQGYLLTSPIQFSHAKGVRHSFSQRCRPWHHNVGRTPPEPHTARNRPQRQLRCHPGRSHGRHPLRLRQWFSAPCQMLDSTTQNQPEPVPWLCKPMKNDGDVQKSQHTLNNITRHIHMCVKNIVEPYISDSL